MYKLDLPIDIKEASAIEKRRCREEERKQRIFNAKIRQIGLDTTALDIQVNEKHRREENERHRNEIYAAFAARNDKIAQLMELRQQTDLKELNRALNEFRFLHQQAEQRREFDLYDPDALKKDRPARVSDDDPRCGVASLQKFEGEDLNNKSRSEFQKEQMKRWLDIQRVDKMRSQQCEKQSQHLYDLKSIELDKRACELADAEEDCRRAINLAVKNYNNALNMETMERRRLKQIQDENDRKTHIINALNSDLLTENPAQAISAFGANRLLPDRFKGMSADQLNNILEIQKQQMEDKKIREMEEKKINDLFDKKRVLEDRAATLIEREIERNRNLIQKKLAEDNVELSKEQKATLKYLDEELYTNQPTAAYFMQFNTCSR